MTIDTSELHHMTGDHGFRDSKKPLQHGSECCYPSDGARYEARPISELVPHMAGGYKSCQNFENLGCLLIIVRSRPVLLLALVGTFG
jgi:hypothetical protein